MSSDSESKENLFRELVPTAKRVLHQNMTNPGNPKLAISVAQDVLDRAGETKKAETRQATQIVITNSQVAILAKVADEVEAKLMQEGELLEPTSKELEHVVSKTEG